MERCRGTGMLADSCLRVHPQQRMHRKLSTAGRYFDGSILKVKDLVNAAGRKKGEGRNCNLIRPSLYDIASEEKVSERTKEHHKVSIGGVHPHIGDELTVADGQIVREIGRRKIESRREITKIWKQGMRRSAARDQSDGDPHQGGRSP
eukprot:CAMPEP_0174719648 /NCGR_PEP_ID=MMETSP1094-20130205/31627_1 /TAXON_ID=156173 /ORGANISM="Chrysochromulina brevifilum, Strain UTEX LB 985" /LENGTH=147 /DNA_ID=CAMNT_0015919987 /DNA_START=2633 /DNA_END=3072 /DNA_ORIENTATION=+